MKHWRFFLILVKQEVLKNMNLSDKLSFSKCSKKCWNLLSRIPNHLKFLKIPSHPSYSVLITCRKSTIHKLIVKIYSLSEKALADQFIKTLLSEKRNSIKVMELVMNINPEYSEMYKKFIEFCDPAFIESIKIENVGSQEIYEDILKSPQWKNSQKVSLNWNFDGLLKVDIDDFLHFKSIKLEMEELSVEDAWKLVQNFLNIGSQNDSIDIRMEKPVPEGLIRQKIETELVGDWKDAGLVGGRYLVHPEKPNLVIECIARLNAFYVGFLLLDEFNFKRSLNPIPR